MNEMVDRVEELIWDWLDDRSEGDERELARRIIAAMREPTAEMIQSRIDSYPAELRIRQSDLDTYQAMIDTALKD